MSEQHLPLNNFSCIIVQVVSEASEQASKGSTDRAPLITIRAFAGPGALSTELKALLFESAAGSKVRVILLDNYVSLGYRRQHTTCMFMTALACAVHTSSTVKNRYNVYNCPQLFCPYVQMSLVGSNDLRPTNVLTNKADH